MTWPPVNTYYGAYTTEAYTDPMGVQRKYIYCNTYYNGSQVSNTTPNMQGAFNVIDTSGNSYLSHTEFNTWMTNAWLGVGPQLTTTEMNDLFANLDTNVDAKLSFSEWTPMVLNTQST